MKPTLQFMKSREVINNEPCQVIRSHEGVNAVVYEGTREKCFHHKACSLSFRNHPGTYVVVHKTTGR